MSQAGEKALVTVSDLGGGVRRLLLNDSESRNAMTEEMSEAFLSAVEGLIRDRSARVVMLTGAGKAFSGGGHLEMLQEKTKLSLAENRRRMEEFYHNFLSVLRIPVPVIAALNGHAIGAGLCVALACDLRLCHAEAKLGLNFVHLGLHPGMGVTYTLPRIVGPAKATELLTLGRILTAEESLRYGMVNEVVAGERFEERVLAVANEIAAVGGQAVRALKESLAHSLHRTLDQCLEREAEAQAEDYCGAEFLEGVTAAREKRKPRFFGDA